MNNPTEKGPLAPGQGDDQSYRQALLREGLQPSDDLVARLRTLHRATLTAGLVLRAFNLWRGERRRASGATTNGQPAA